MLELLIQFTGPKQSQLGLFGSIIQVGGVQKQTLRQYGIFWLSELIIGQALQLLR